MDSNEFQKYKKELKQLKVLHRKHEGQSGKVGKIYHCYSYSLSEKALVNEGFLDQNFGLLNLIDIFNH